MFYRQIINCKIFCKNNINLKMIFNIYLYNNLMSYNIHVNITFKIFTESYTKEFNKCDIIINGKEWV